MNSNLDTLTDPPQYVKAIYAFVTTLLSQLGVIMVNDADLGDITQAQWVVIALACTVVTGGVFGLRNKTGAQV